MMKTSGAISKVVILPAVILSLGIAISCSREQPPGSPQPAQAPVATGQQSQPAAPAMQAQPSPSSSSPSQQPTRASTLPPPAGSNEATAPVIPGAAALPTASPQNFNQVQVGMTSQEVLRILGNPSRIKQERQYLEWEYYTSQGKFEVKFQGDRVAYISRH